MADLWRAASLGIVPASRIGASGSVNACAANSLARESVSLARISLVLVYRCRTVYNQGFYGKKEARGGEDQVRGPVVGVWPFFLGAGKVDMHMVWFFYIMHFGGEWGVWVLCLGYLLWLVSCFS